MTELTKEQILAEIEDLLRIAPSRDTIKNLTNENYAWLGRVSAVIGWWNSSEVHTLKLSLIKMESSFFRDINNGFSALMILLHQARSDLQVETKSFTNVAISKGMYFDYFDELRKTIELAKQDLLFVDPYLDAEFVSRYLPHVTAGVTIRLLSREKLNSLLPAVETFAQQEKASIEVRSSQNFHDRYIFVDKIECYQSGASFKDGAKSSPTTLTQITDAFPAVLQTYEDLWNRGRVEY